MKKTILILSLITTFQANADCAEEGYFDCGDTGDVKWYLSSDKKTLSIVGTGAMGDYEQNKITSDGETINYTTAPWKDYTFDVENILVAEGVTSVGDHSFCSFKNTTNVSLPSTLETIGNRAFRNLETLTEIELPASLISIGAGAFLSDVSLQHINIPNSVTTIEAQAFYNAINLQNIVIPSSVTSIGENAFGALHSRIIAGDVYCEQVPDFTSPCSNGNLGIPNGRFKYYTKDDKGIIIFNGQKYSSPEKLAKQLPIRRIYTIEEASKVAGERNTVTIRYK